MSEQEIVVHEPQMVAVDDLAPNEANPNEESDAIFTQLVESIREDGFTQPVIVAEQTDEGYPIIAGEHRWRAAKVLGMPEIPVVVLPITEDDQQRIRLVRDNAVRGKIDPVRFTKLFNDLANRYGQDAVRRMMGVVEDSTFQKMYRDVRKSLPREVKKRLDQTKTEIANVDDLALTIRKIMTEAGPQLDQSFVTFSFGGREHMLIRCGPRAWRNLQRIAEEAETEGVDFNARVNQLLEMYVPY